MKSVFRCGAAALCLALLSTHAAAAEPERCTLKALEMPVEMIGTQAIVKVGINGAQVPLLVDSGAFYSSLTPAAARQLGLKAEYADLTVRGVGDAVNANVTTVKRMEFQGGVIPDIEFVVVGSELSAGAMGILGRNFLSFSDVEYDFAHGMIRFIFPKGECADGAQAYWAGDKPIVMLPLLREETRRKHPSIRAVAQVNEERIRVLFDTGASSSVLTLSAALRAGIKKDEMRPAGFSVGIGKSRNQNWLAEVKRFALGGEQVSDLRMRIADYDLRDVDMLLGMDFFLAHRVYVSKAQRRMYFTHNGGPVFAESRRDATVASAEAAASAPESAQPLDAAGYARRGAAKAGRRDYAGALADLDRACELAPQQADYFLRRGVVHLSLRNAQLARQDFDTALKLEPTLPEALLRRAGLRPAAERDAALEDLRTLDRTLAPQAHERLFMGRLYERFELLKEAIAQWTHWIPERNDDAQLPGALDARCRARTRLGIELDAALDDCNKAVKAESKNAGYRDSRGWLQLRRGDAGRALSDFEASLELRPEQAWPLYGRGIARKQQGETEAGKADIEAARKLRPTIDADAARLGLPAAG